ncbi:MAG: elongation factor P [Salinivirgaceae bacterium]|nr:elongation factor P [Salinivirgaceae bacterium]MDY0278965.1 elongation factor P [Salinivirgaceae bacterium]
MADTTDIKNGATIKFKDGLYQVVQFQHVKPGKGPAFVRTKLKNLETGRIVENTFNSGVKIDLVRIERRPYQFLYKEGLNYVFMHKETYEQVYIEEKLINAVDLMKEGQEIEIVFHAETETPLTAELPAHVDLEITYTEPGLKGDTASSTALKDATVETGATIKVPLFINIGDKIKVDTREYVYAERIK